MFGNVIHILITFRNYFLYRWYDFLANLKSEKFELDPQASFVFSVTSYPKRASLLPAVIQAISLQTTKPKYIYLVLAEEDWPNKCLPNYILKLVKRGVDIIWTRNNPYAVKVITPIIKKHPDLGIIPFDDDLIYDKNIVEKLLEVHSMNNGCIIGHVGKSLHRKGENLGMMYRDDKHADTYTPSNQVYFLKGSGTYYPPGSLDSRVTNISAINRIVPGRGADLWLWAAAIAKGTRQICLGTPTDRNLYIPIPQNLRTAPKDQPGSKIMEQRFQMAVDYFGIRKKLLEELPDKES